MVLQRGMQVPLWGWAANGEKITVRFHKQIKTVTTGTDGRWKLYLDAEKEGGPYQLKITGNNEVVFNDILVGDVWICSGQSNMEFAIREAENSGQEIATSDYPMIRHTKIPPATAGMAQMDLLTADGWHAATRANVGDFTAVGYFFARSLFKELHVPIGLINSSWSGSDIETWMSREALQNSTEFSEMMKGFSTIDINSVLSLRKKELELQLAAMNNSQPSAKAIIWLHREIDVPAAYSNQAAKLFLGRIDDNDETFVNNTSVGKTQGFNVRRAYRVPVNILKEGKNVIDVRVEKVFDSTGSNDAAPGDMQLVFDNNSVISLLDDWHYRVEWIKQTPVFDPNIFPTLLYNSMINPLIPYAIKGVVWYQGESNAIRAYQYRTAFPLMINDWRSRWKQGDFPFYYVQLSSFYNKGGTSETGSEWAELREAQTLALSLPNTGMAVTTDIGEAEDIHPRNKQDVGKRLAAVALNKTYKRSNEFSGPVFKSIKIEGEKVIINFDHTGSGLITTDAKGVVGGFEIAGADKKFIPASAFIEGDHIVIRAAGANNPVAVRYAWADFAGNANLYNLEKFPAVPFRTDNWKGVTEERKYKIAGK